MTLWHTAPTWQSLRERNESRDSLARTQWTRRALDRHPRAVANARRHLGPAKFVKPRITNAEVMGNFVDHRLTNLRLYLVFVGADAADGRLVQSDSIGHHAAVALDASLRERYALIQTKEISSRRFVLDQDYDVVHT